MANPIIGHMECFVCAALLGRKVKVAINLEKEGAGKAYYICDGRADPDQPACMSHVKLGHIPTARLKKLTAEGERGKSNDVIQPTEATTHDDIRADQSSDRAEPAPEQPRRRGFRLGR